MAEYWVAGELYIKVTSFMNYLAKNPNEMFYPNLWNRNFCCYVVAVVVAVAVVVRTSRHHRRGCSFRHRVDLGPEIGRNSVTFPSGLAQKLRPDFLRQQVEQLTDNGRSFRPQRFGFPA